MRLLVVDDEIEIREGIREAIPWGEYGIEECIASRNASSALQIINEYKPDIIILDIMMEGMDGLEFLEVIRNHFPNIQVILISGYDEFTYAQRAVSLHAFRYLLKPLDDSDLINAVTDARDEINKRLNNIKNSKELNDILSVSKPLLQEQFFHLILENQLREEEEITRYGAALGIDLSSSVVTGIFLLPDLPKEETSESYGDFSLYTAVIKNYLQENYTAMGFYSFFYHELLGLLSLKKTGVDLSKTLINIKNWINNELKIGVTIGIGGSRGKLESARRSFHEAKQCLNAIPITGPNKIIYYKNLSFSHKRDTSFRQELEFREERLIQDLLNGVFPNVDVLSGELSSLFSEYLILENDGGFNRLLSDLLLFLVKIVVNLGLKLDSKGTDLERASLEILDVQSVAELDDFLSRFLTRIIKEMECRRERHNSFLIESALAVIGKNRYKDISLSWVAGELNVHPVYLSKIFKEEMNICFIDYVISVKVKEAKRMLKETNLKIYEIAGELGYMDVDHFTSLFKKQVGISPSQYRRIG
ncbi:MAG: response regulator [Spirochaetia bacterium]